MRSHPFDGGPLDERDEDCACAKSGLYQPDCPDCAPRDEDEEYIKAFYEQEMRFQ